MSKRKLLLSTYVDDMLRIDLRIAYGRSHFDSASVHLKDGALSECTVQGMRDDELLAKLRAAVAALPSANAYYTMVRILTEAYGQAEGPQRSSHAPPSRSP